jgi:hypothetical protein
MANKLEVSVGIQNAGFKAGLDQMRAGAAKFKADVPTMFTSALTPFSAMAGKVKAGFAGVFSSIKGGLASMGALIGVGAVVKTITDTIALGDSLADLSEKLGVSSESLQAWKNHVEQNGASLEGLAASMAKVELNRDKALKGDEKMVQSFEALGISIEDLKTMGLDQLMLKIGSSTMSAGSMVAVMGEQALDLKAALASAAEEGLNFSNVMSEKTVDSLGKVSDAWTKFKTWITSNVGELLASVLDAGSIIFTGKPYVADNKEEKAEKRKKALERLAGEDDSPQKREKEKKEKENAEKEAEKKAKDEMKKAESDVTSAEGRRKQALRDVASVPVDSLGAVGGGRGNFGGGDAALRVAERHLSIAQQSLTALQTIAAKQPSEKADPWR